MCQYYLYSLTEAFSKSVQLYTCQQNYEQFSWCTVKFSHHCRTTLILLQQTITITTTSIITVGVFSSPRLYSKTTELPSTYYSYPRQFFIPFCLSLNRVNRCSTRQRENVVIHVVIYMSVVRVVFVLNRVYTFRTTLLLQYIVALSMCCGVVQ